MHNRKLEEGIGGVMGISMNDLTAQKKLEKVNLIKRIITMVFGVGSVVMFFLPYAQFVFKDTKYVTSGLDLLIASGFRVETGTTSALIGIPVLIRIAVIAGAVFALAGTVLIFFKRPVLSGLSFIISAITPLVVLISTASIQSDVTALNISHVTVGYMVPFIYVLVAGLVCAVLSLSTQGVEKLARAIFLTFACVSIAAVLTITVYIFSAGIPAMAEIGVFKFLFGTTWDASTNQFGILPLILASICGTVGAIIIGVPIGILTAVFLTEIARPRVAKIIHPAIELLAGIPSVVYGFFGMLVIVPAIRAMFPGQTIGDSLLAAIIILAIMVIPTIVNVTENAIRAVPKSYREASLGLGATPIRTIFKVTIPAARSGILSGVILGVGRAIGETMAVIMVAGNVANMPTLLGTTRFLTTGIAMEMSYASGLHRQALFAIGLVLFIFIMIVNISFTIISRKGAKVNVK